MLGYKGLSFEAKEEVTLTGNDPNKGESKRTWFWHLIVTDGPSILLIFVGPFWYI